MKVRAKFTVSQVTVMGDSTGQAMCYSNGQRTDVPFRIVKMYPIYDKSNPEDVSFSEASPSGTIELHVNNPVLKDSFNPGDVYYVDFTPVQK